MGKQIQIPQQQQQQQHHNPLQQQQRILQKHQQQQPKLIPHNQGQQHSGPVAPNNHPSPQVIIPSGHISRSRKLGELSPCEYTIPGNKSYNYYLEW